MRISKIRVNNFRSIEDVEITLSNFNVFVGQNNHGKTNFFEAINWFYSGKSGKDMKYMRDDSKDIIVEIEFQDAQEGISGMSNETAKTKMTHLLDGADSFTVKKTSVDDKRVFIVDGIVKTNPAGFDNALNQFIPKMEYVTTKIRLADVSKYKSKSPIAEMLSGVLSAIISTSPDYQAFKDQFDDLFNQQDSEVRVELNKLGDRVQVFLQKQFPEDTTVKFSVENPVFDDLLKNFETEVDDGVKTTAEEKGDGMQRAIMLSIIQAYAQYRKEKRITRDFLFLIDEAELHLHPSGQRALKNALLDIAKEGDQVFVNTHSSVLVADSNELQSIFKVEKNNKKTDIIKSDEIMKMNIIYELLGGNPADLLLPVNFLIVEGQSEFYFLDTIIRRFYKEQFGKIKILFARGDIREQEKRYIRVAETYTPLNSPVYKERVVFIFDKPNISIQSKYDDFKKNHPYLVDNEHLHQLPTETLEEYYPGEWKKTREEFEQMAGEQELEGYELKVSYAREVGESITQEEFEQNMPILKSALDKAVEKGFN